jgi:hypothetical protein
MIIAKNWHLDVKDDNDGNTIITHNVDNTAIAEQAKFIRENTDRGFTYDREMQLVGYIPFDIFHKEGLHKRPMEDAFKFMESDAMTPFRVSRKKTNHSGKIIIK